MRSRFLYGISKCLLPVLGLGLLISTNVSIAQESPVSITGSLDSSKKGSSNYAVTLAVRIQPGWHLYDVGPKDGSAVRAVVDVETPTGVSKVGKVERPLSLPYAKKPGAKIIQLNAFFSQKLKIESDFQGGEVKLKLKYQVCNDKLCQPPNTLTTSVRIPAAKATKDDEENEGLFAAPIMLKVDDKPLNSAARQMYPSPAVFDIDNDGKDELVVGDIFGSLNVYENLNESKDGDPVWSKHETLKSADGKPIKVKNW